MPKQLVKKDGRGFVLFYDPNVGRWAYELPEGAVCTRRGMLREIVRLSEKNWFTATHAAQLITLMGIK